MGVETTVRCDQCRIERGPANHWLLLWRNVAGHIEIAAWDWAMVLADDRKLSLCGQDCLHRVLSRKMSEGEL